MSDFIRVKMEPRVASGGGAWMQLRNAEAKDTTSGYRSEGFRERAFMTTASTETGTEHPFRALFSGIGGCERS